MARKESRSCSPSKAGIRRAHLWLCSLAAGFAAAVMGFGVGALLSVEFESQYAFGSRKTAKISLIAASGVGAVSLIYFIVYFSIRRTKHQLMSVRMDTIFLSILTLLGMGSGGFMLFNAISGLWVHNASPKAGLGTSTVRLALCCLISQGMFTIFTFTALLLETIYVAVNHKGAVWSDSFRSFTANGQAKYERDTRTVLIDDDVERATSNEDAFARQPMLQPFLMSPPSSTDDTLPEYVADDVDTFWPAPSSASSHMGAGASSSSLATSSSGLRLHDYPLDVKRPLMT